ncbi:EF-hand domain-containing protein [Alteromonas lipotrueiana]|uniref:EF-hand domain-containing protein n=1 Tax=Alteromonas lipotrueiana TaxID=2803815 RepID=UPI001C43EA87|nr:EF-hand domain-containing protein [Alteromonas lipotrueiana]
MKKLTLAVVISGALSTAAYAHNNMEKIGSTFNSLDNNGDQMVSMEEVKDAPISEYFEKIDKNGDQSLSENEYVTFYDNNPKAFSDQVKEDIQLTKATVEADMDKVAKQSREDMDYQQENISATVEEGSSEMTQGMRESNTMEHAAKSHGQDSMNQLEQDRDTEVAYMDDNMRQSEDGMATHKAFEMMDKNGDGHVTEDEASEADVIASFNEIDQNEDNKITHSEFQEYRESEQADEE